MEIHDCDIIKYVTTWPTVPEILHLNHAWLYREQTKIQLYNPETDSGFKGNFSNHALEKQFSAIHKIVS